MTGPPAFSDTPQGSKTAGNTGSSPESEAFIAECSDDEYVASLSGVERAAASYRRRYPTRGYTVKPRTQTVHITLTVDIPGDLRAAAAGALRREFPRGKWEITDAD